MAIRMTGLNSGLNTDSIVQALMSAQRTKQTKIKNKQTKLEWKQEKWAALNTKLYNFYKGPLSSMRFSKNYRTKAASSSNTTKVTANATVNASTGTYKVKVDSLASTQYVTSGKLKGAATYDDNGALKDYSGKVTENTKLSDIDGFAATGTQIHINSGGKDVYLDVDENTTVKNFLDACTNAGLSATFDEGQQRFFISSLKSGEDNKFTITAGTMSATQKAAMDNFKESVKYNYLSSSDRGAVDSIMADLRAGKKTAADVEASLKEIAKRGADNEALAKANKFYSEKSTYEAGQAFISAVGSVGAKSKDDIKNDLTGAADLDTYYENIRKSLADTSVTKYGETTPSKLDISIPEASSFTGTPAERAEAMAAAIASARDSYVSAEAAKRMSDYSAPDTADASNRSKVQQLAENGITSGDLIAGAHDTTNPSEYTFDSKTVRDADIDSPTSSTGVASTLATFYSELGNGATVNSNNELASLGLANVDGSAVKENDAGNNGMVVIDAKDTKVQFNGATLTSTDTNISVAGLELNLLGETDEEITITVTNDVSAIYDTVKEFLTEYNSILKELNTNYNAASSKDYDVLTDDQKDAMSDTEVEKWEAKIKDSLLRRDSTLGNLVSSMRNNMMGAFVGSDGKRYSLATLGIVTSGDYAEGGLLHIKGDEDDEEYSEENNVLMSMLQEDPDKVMEILTHFSSALYDDLQKKMSRSALSSALTFYNDKEMSSQLSDYKKEVSKWETKLNDMEDRYYSQFTAMESALAKLQSQQSALSQYLGM